MLKKFILVTFVLMIASSISCFAGQLGQNAQGSFYVKDDGNLATSEWVTIDTDGQGVVMYYYYFGADGFMVKNGVTPDGYLVNSIGQWVKDGQIQVKACPKRKNSTTIDLIKSKITSLSIKKRDALYPGYYVVMKLSQTEPFRIICYGLENNGAYYKPAISGTLEATDVNEFYWMPKNMADAQSWTDHYRIGKDVTYTVANEDDTMQLVEKSKNINNIDTTVSTLVCKVRGDVTKNEDDMYFNILCNSIGVIDIIEVDDSYIKKF